MREVSKLNQTRCNLSKSPTFLGNFCKGVKIHHFSSDIIFRQLLYTFGNFFLVTLILIPTIWVSNRKWFDFVTYFLWSFYGALTNSRHWTRMLFRPQLTVAQFKVSPKNVVSIFEVNEWEGLVWSSSGKRIRSQKIFWSDFEEGRGRDAAWCAAAATFIWTIVKDIRSFMSEIGWWGWNTSLPLSFSLGEYQGLNLCCHLLNK